MNHPFAKNRKPKMIGCKPWPDADEEMRSVWAYFRRCGIVRGPFQRSATIRLAIQHVLDVRDAAKAKEKTS